MHVLICLLLACSHAESRFHLAFSDDEEEDLADGILAVSLYEVEECFQLLLLLYVSFSTKFCISYPL